MSADTLTSSQSSASPEVESVRPGEAPWQCKEIRHELQATYLNVVLAMQIRAMREARGWSQAVRVWVDEEQDIMASIDDLKGCLAHGRDIGEALDTIHEVMMAWLQSCRDDAPGGNGKVPRPKCETPEDEVNAVALLKKLGFECEPAPAPSQSVPEQPVTVPAACMNAVRNTDGTWHRCEWTGDVNSLTDDECPKCLKKGMLAPRIDIPGTHRFSFQCEELHVYLSTACQHGKHSECRLSCKFCDAKCSCDCGHVAVPEQREGFSERDREIFLAGLGRGFDDCLNAIDPKQFVVCDSREAISSAMRSAGLKPQTVESVIDKEAVEEYRQFCKMRRSLENISMYVRREGRRDKRKNKTDNADSWGHILRFCEEAGVKPNILRDAAVRQPDGRMREIKQ